MFLVAFRMNAHDAIVLFLFSDFVCANRSTIMDYHAVRGVNVVDSHAKDD